MKRFLIIFIVIFVLVVAGRFTLFQTKEQPPRPPEAIKSSQSSVIPTPTVSATQSIPSRVKISAINVDADVESVGLDSQNRMDVPKEDMNVAWYNLGFKPGEKGSAVLAGHYDARTGGPAVFYDLAKLRPGDTIQVTYADNEVFTFTVTDSELYDFDKVPLEDIFNSTDKARLNLITCDGVFNKSSANYSKRLVVYTELSES